MINKLISFSIKNKLIIGLLTLTLVVVGLWSVTKVPLDAVPDITNNQVQVITQAPNLGTEDIEQFVTYPVEVSMANLPGVTEIRSVSRFGLSVVTIVFEDNMGTYLPRQLVSEKLTEVKEEIPNGFGVPEMGPISTGLGEIYQYTLEVEPKFRDKYSPSDLRTMQDWIVRRQMAMVPGVVEVNAFGGDVKQYEVAIDPNELKAIGITIIDVFNALQENNENTGGAYIEKDHLANFIRGEGLIRNLSDIEDIVVKNLNGIPITIKDVAKVQYGKAVKYGAFTKDGLGEVSGGMILMLKGASSNDVVEAVHKRMAEIEKSLPEGVTIEPFLDRSTLIAKTTGTVSQNLIEGALIVIFVLVFLLGNWRGGLIVASTIPLSLLFAFILMNVFGVWANLMSLGAIDFGIIIDGAVIIVEGTVFLLYTRLQRASKEQKITSETRDKVTYEASSKMMNSAFFGQLIILIVFIPILALQGVEGKMFKPMALTFMFAMIGVMILCLTYVPMMSALFLRVNPKKKKTWGDRFIHWLERIYDRVLAKSFKRGKWIVITAVLFLGVATFTFSKMGGEFVPQLDEGDLAFHAILKPGSSLTETIETTTKIEKIIMSKFPEVKHVLCRIGVADVPTDPMPMDIADCFIILKPKSEWVSASSKAELIDKIKEAVEVVPGVNYEFTQPIEMRFNELLTGVREDLAIKLFGEDLDVLAAKAEEIGKIVSTVDGVADMKVEATSGLPQITVNYDRKKLAQYGLNIEELNFYIESAFAGGKAGVIFEGEKRFDLVVRLDEAHKKSIDNLKNLYVNLPNGSQLPLRELADISYQAGPMQISRDNTNRRTYVGINVRGRDIQSVVDDIEKKLDAELDLPPGYYIRYGGAFENLERASERLKIVVPIALGLIFLLIFFALKSFKQSIMIYMAIPLAAIGGIFSLWMRGMPFSISAGVGFIVLFGVAVLNGLVLISGWNELKEEGVTDIDERIRLGAKRRIRPILLTALTDVLGFLPMAISTSAGAEVQQPLATVVIGGMITATLLTLFVLPILYRWVENRSLRKSKGIAVPALGVLLLLVLPSNLIHAQTSDSTKITRVEEAIDIGLKNNGYMRSSQMNVELLKVAEKSAVNIDQTDFNVQYGQYNSFENDFGFDVSQSFEFPTVYSTQKKLAKKKTTEGEIKLSAVANDLRREIKVAWYELAFDYEKLDLLKFQDSLYSEFLHAATVRYEAEEGTYLEKVSAETQLMQIQNELSLIEVDISIQEQKLKMLLNDSSNVVIIPDKFDKMELNATLNSELIQANPNLRAIQQQIILAQAEKSVNKAKMLPNLSIGYFNQSMIGSQTVNGNIATTSDRFSGVQGGISIPLFFGSYKAQIKMSEIKSEIAEVNAEYFQTALTSQYEQALNEVLKLQGSLNYYEESALSHAELIIENAQKSFLNGAINYIEYFQSIRQALDVKINYINTVKGFNNAVININHLIDQ
jgi:cobalt-zinc-cadmium resistance protein CzcA